MTIASPEVPFGKRLKLARVLRGMTTRQLGNVLNVAHTTISRLERSVILPSAEDRVRLAEVLGEASLIDCPLVVHAPIRDEQLEKQRQRYRARAAKSPLKVAIPAVDAAA